MAKLTGHLFARLALDYFDHPKIAVLSAEAVVAHLEMIVYSRRYGTDGRIPNRIANRFGSESLTELASNDPDRPSIAIHDDGSVIVHDYAEYQETREQIEARRQVNAANGRKGGRTPNRTAKRTGTQSASDSGGEMKAETETETEHSSTKSGGTKRATRLPDDWTPTEAHRALAAERGVDCDLEASKMRDWATAEGKTGKDWNARFRLWINSARPDARQQHTRPNRDAASARGLVQAHEDLFGRNT